MRHIFILDKVEDPPVTGQRKIVQELAVYLSKLERDVYIYSEVLKSRVEGIKVARFKDLATLPRKDKNTFIEYHVSADVFKKTFWTKFFGNPRVLYSFMGGDLEAIFSSKSSLSKLVFEHIVDTIIVVAGYQTELIRKYVDIDVAVIPPFVDIVSCQSKLSREELDEPVKLLFMGIPSFEKGFDVLLEACELMHREYPSLHVVVADSGENFQASLEAMKLIKESKVVDKIDYLGVVDALETLSTVDLFVYPARTIRNTMAIPLSILESLSVGTPAVSTDIGGVSEILSSTYIAEPGDSQSLYQAMKKALDLGDAPPIPSRFLKENVLRQYLRLYDRLSI